MGINTITRKSLFLIARYSLPAVETLVENSAAELINDLDVLLNELETRLYAELEWQLEIPDETSLESESFEAAESVDHLFDDLANTLQLLDDALAEESGQELNPP